MNKSQELEVIRLTQECWYRYWKLDVEFMLGYCDENVSWIGAEQCEFIQGFKNVKQNFDELLNHLRVCHLLNQEIFIAQNCGKVCTVIGRHLVTTSDENDYFLQVQQRYTFVWELKGDRLSILHIHVSNPMGELKSTENERFVNSLGYMANQYLKRKLEEKLSKKQMILIDENGAMRFVYMSEILYVTANHNDLIIQTINGTINAKLSISQFMKQSDNEFQKVHRSYAININYMSKLERYIITMTNGEKIPVPVKKYNSIRDELMKIHGDDRLSKKFDNK